MLGSIQTEILYIDKYYKLQPARAQYLTAVTIAIYFLCTVTVAVCCFRSNMSNQFQLYLIIWNITFLSLLLLLLLLFNNIYNFVYYKKCNIYIYIYIQLYNFKDIQNVYKIIYFQNYIVHIYNYTFLKISIIYNYTFFNIYGTYIHNYTFLKIYSIYIFFKYIQYIHI